MDLLQTFFKRWLASFTLTTFLLCASGCDDEAISAEQLAGRYSFPSTGTSFLFINANGTYRHVFRMADHPEMVSEGSWEEIPGDYHQIVLANFCAFPSERVDDESTRPGYRCIGIGRSWGRVWINLGSLDTPRRVFKAQ